MNEPTELDVILGGVTITAKLRDGKSEEVKVRQLPMRLLTTKWSQSLGNEPALAELYCDKDEGWDDTLLPESHDEIVAIGEKLNFFPFQRWATAQRAMVERMSEIKATFTDGPASKNSSTTAASS